MLITKATLTSRRRKKKSRTKKGRKLCAKHDFPKPGAKTKAKSKAKAKAKSRMPLKRKNGARRFPRSLLQMQPLGASQSCFLFSCDHFSRSLSVGLKSFGEPYP